MRPEDAAHAHNPPDHTGEGVTHTKKIVLH
jgi:hypothetical protein